MTNRRCGQDQAGGNKRFAVALRLRVVPDGNLKRLVWSSLDYESRSIEAGTGSLWLEELVGMRRHVGFNASLNLCLWGLNELYEIIGEFVPHGCQFFLPLLKHHEEIARFRFQIFGGLFASASFDFLTLPEFFRRHACERGEYHR